MWITDRLKLVSVFAALLSAGCQSVTSESDTFFSDVGSPTYNATISFELRAPEGPGPHPIVLLMHGCSGLTQGVYQGLRDHASYLVQNGFAAAIVDSFSNRGLHGGRICKDFPELGAARRYRVHDAYNALATLAQRPEIDGARAFLVGQSNGGSVAINAAKNRAELDIKTDTKFRAIAAYYPWCGALDGATPDFETPLLAMVGSQDDWTPPGLCVWAGEMPNARNYKVISYDGAHHGFDLPIDVQTYKGHTVGANRSATLKSREDYLSFFRANLR